VANLLLSGRVIAYHAELAHVTGSVNAGLMLSQFYFWTGTLPPERDGWFYKGREELMEETGLSRREQETARKILVTLGILEEERRGVPARMWYRLDKSRIYDLLLDRANKMGGNVPTGWAESAQLDGPNRTNLAGANAPSITEMTSETTHRETRERGKEILREKIEALKAGKT